MHLFSFPLRQPSIVFDANFSALNDNGSLHQTRSDPYRVVASSWRSACELENFIKVEVLHCIKRLDIPIFRLTVLAALQLLVSMEFANPPPPFYDGPPTYDDYKKDVERLKQKAATDPVFKKKVNDNFVKGAGSKENLKKIQEDVKKFTDNIKNINAAFDDIRVKLYEIDMKGLKDSKGNVWKGEDKWKVIRDNWKSLLKASQDTALRTIARCDEFQLLSEGALKIKDINDQRYKDTITELENFIKKAGPDGTYYNPQDVTEKAMKHSTDFSDLKDKLQNFKVEFDSFANYQKTQIDSDIAELNAKITKIEIEIAFDATMILSLGTALGVTTFATLAGGVILAGMGPLSPLAIIGLVIGALLALGEAGALIYFITDWYQKSATRDGWKNDVKNKEALKTALQSVMSKLENQRDGLGFVITQVDLLKNAWLTIHNEAFLIQEMLKKAKDMKTLTYYQDQIQDANNAYKELSISLTNYSNA